MSGRTDPVGGVMEVKEFIKNNFEDLEVRASVNMEIGTIEGMEYITNYFDSYYMKREYNRDIEKVAELKKWCDENGKKLFGLANSGCLNFCSLIISAVFVTSS